MTNTTFSTREGIIEAARPVRSLPEIFLNHRAHLSDKWEQYLSIYDMVLSPRVAEGRPLRLLEIGVQNGGSLQVWAEYLPPGSSVVGIDIDPACADLSLGASIQVHIGDASSNVELDRLLGNDSFDVIVDDGSHRSDHIISTFKACLPRLTAGGAYIIEDLHASYLKDAGGGFHRKDAAIEWLKLLTDAINADHLDTASIDSLSLDAGMDMRAAGSEIARVSFYDSVAVVEKALEIKIEPFRRVMSGTVAYVSNLDQQLARLPASQLRSLTLSPSALEAFGSRIIAELANAYESLGAAAHQRSVLEDSITNLARQSQERSDHANAKLDAVNEAFSRVKAGIAAERERALKAEHTVEDLKHQLALAEPQIQAVDARVLQAEEKVRSIVERALRAEETLNSIVASTTWKATQPLRAFGSRLPIPVRTGIRRVAKLAWWTSTGQIGARLRARVRQVTGSATAVNAPPVPTESQSSVAPPIAATPTQIAADPYVAWCDRNTISNSGYALQRRVGSALWHQPIFSVLVPVYNTPADVFEAMVQSVLRQSYSRWQLCLAVVDTGAPAEHLLQKTEELARADARVRVKVLPENLGISGNSNAALDLVDGEWTVLLDHDDELTQDALFELARAANANPGASFIYSDKDMLSRDGARRFNPFFKPGWSPDTLLNANYLTHVCAMRSTRIREVGGWDPTTDGAQDWDLFLRVIGRDGCVVHVPKVLYHWRVIETSVAFGGFDVKPYAAEGQLRTLLKHLPQAGWPTAKPRFEHGQIRIDWGTPQLGPILLIVCGGELHPHHVAASLTLDAIVKQASGDELYRQIDGFVAESSASLIVLLDATFLPMSPAALHELVAPMGNPNLAMTAGRVFAADGLLLEFGTFIRDGRAYPAFRGQPSHYFIPGGSVSWYRNASAAPGGALAFRRDDWQAVGGFTAFAHEGRPDIAFSLAVVRRSGRRLLLNPYASFKATGQGSIFEQEAIAPLSSEFIRRELPLADQFVSPALDIETQPGVPCLPDVARTMIVSPSHDFAAEARYVAGAFDATSSQVHESIEACRGMTPGPLRRMAWFIPSFVVPFYGGIYTILRSADYLRREHQVEAVFVVLGDAGPEETIARIGMAFPELARTATVRSMKGPHDPLPDLGELDAAAATLWTTAFPVLKLRRVRRKLYFLQDWEPLFYPAGTISATVEATYRFGFYAICNTPSLATSYAELGGAADYFLPAVDTSVFHSKNRPARPVGSPFVLVCYARPGTPRNCFESLAEALKRLKKKYGESLEIVTAGQSWNAAPYGLDGLISNLGLLSYEETGALYRAADAGLVAMATRHPSYLPFELMACGAAVVTNRNSTTSWLLRDQENCLLCEMTPSDIYEAVSQLIENPALRDSLVAKARQDIEASHSDWNATCERIYTLAADHCREALEIKRGV